MNCLGPAIEPFSMEGTHDLCNMAIEGGRPLRLTSIRLHTSLLHGRPMLEPGELGAGGGFWWQSWPAGLKAHFDDEGAFDCSALGATVTWGITRPGGSASDEAVPTPEQLNPTSAPGRAGLLYMDLTRGAMAGSNL